MKKILACFTIFLFFYSCASKDETKSGNTYTCENDSESGGDSLICHLSDEEESQKEDEVYEEVYEEDNSEPMEDEDVFQESEGRSKDDLVCEPELETRDDGRRVLIYVCN